MAAPKSLVIDANILFSFFKSDSTRKYLIERLLNLNCKLFSPEFVFEELSKDKERIIKFCGINESEFSYVFSLLKKEIITSPQSKYKEFLSKSKRLAPHNKDIPYFELVILIGCPIWSDEKAFRKQDEIKILSTSELIKDFGLFKL